MPSSSPVGTAYKPARFVRHPLTQRNQEEIGIATKVPSILDWENRRWQGHPAVNWVRARPESGENRWVAPTGFSINKVRYHEFPEAEQTAHERGWYAYMNIGVPLIEERSDIEQPPPDVISKQTYINRNDPEPAEWENTVEFSISNQVSWSLQGQVQLTFGARTSAALQQQLQKSMAMRKHHKTTLLGSKDRTSADGEAQAEATNTTTATGTATGTGELSADLMLAISAAVSGSLTTSWTQRSTLRGNVNSRVEVMATQRRQVKQFDYELPITFGGYVALYYPEPVQFNTIYNHGEYIPVQTRDQTGRTPPPKSAQVVAYDVDVIGLIEDGKRFTQQGTAETVSTLAGEHQVFEAEILDLDDSTGINREVPLFKS